MDGLDRAADVWASACPHCEISFVRLDEDEEADASGSDFVVRYHDSSGAYLAHAFFPHVSKERRYLEIDPLFFQSGVDRVGILSHELGHILGYRHPRQAGLNSCYLDTDGLWHPFTHTKFTSVMHAFCTTGLPSLSMTEADAKSHRAAYSAVASGPRAEVDSTDRALSRYLPGVVDVSDPSLFEKVLSFPLFDVSDAAAALYRKDGELFVVEGDIPLTLSEVGSYLASQSMGDKPILPKPELLVNVFKGKRDYYPNGNRKLSYYIDEDSFKQRSDYLKVAVEFNRAVHDWQDLCPSCRIDFERIEKSHVDVAKTNFVIRFHDSHGAYVVSSFFPHTEQQRRVVNIDPSYFRTQDSVGILRHSIGHILGYSHGLHGQQPCLESTMRAISIMQVACDGHLATGRIGAGDVESHRDLYSPKQGNQLSFTGFLDALLRDLRSDLRVQFEGGDVKNNVLKVYRELIHEGHVHVASDVDSDDPIDNFFDVDPDADLISFDSDLGAFLGKELATIERASAFQRRMVHPDALLEPYLFYRTFDISIPQDEGRFRKLQESWSGLLVSQSETNGIAKVAYRGYRLTVRLSSPAQVTSAAHGLARLNLENTFVIDPNQFSGATVRKGGGYFGGPVEVGAMDFWQDCCGTPGLQDVPEGKEGSLGGLIDAPLGAHLDTCDKECPEIVLVDSGVFLHADVTNAIVEGGVSAIHRGIVRNGKQIITVLPSLTKSDHGTYMAGIIGSQHNGFGLIGVHPAARIYPFRWDDYKENISRFNDLLTHRLEREPMQIVVFANIWDYPALPDEQNRFDNLVAESIRTNPAMLWVVAAGQNDDVKAKGEEISKHYTHGPMNLGDQRNVIVVTAVDKMADPHLLAFANYSKEGMVHIAAPGENIPGLASEDRYAIGTGTSPATALVAGTASAMVSSFPAWYNNRAERVKTRLQVTARPALSNQDALRVASGVLDYALALKDPDTNWVKGLGQADFVKVDAFRWCTPQLSLVDPMDDTKLLGGAPIRTSDILRLYRNENNGKWTIYTKGATLGEVHRIGPGEVDEAPLFESTTIRNLCPPYGLCTSNGIGDVVIKASLSNPVGCN
jgi:hypothetical protein